MFISKVHLQPFESCKPFAACSTLLEIWGPLLHVNYPGASLGFNSCKHVFTGYTLKQSLRKLFCTASLVVFRMHCWFFIRTQDQQTTYQFSELLLTTWVKLAKQVQMFLKAHHQHIFPDLQLNDSESILQRCQEHCKDHILKSQTLSQELLL